MARKRDLRLIADAMGMPYHANETTVMLVKRLVEFSAAMRRERDRLHEAATDSIDRAVAASRARDL